MLSFSATGSTGELDGLMARLAPAALQVPVTEAAKAIQEHYETEAPKDTGSMAASIYVVPALGEPQADYENRSAAADSANEHVVLHPKLPAPAAPGAAVGVAADHAFYVEYGRGMGKRTPRPTFTDAVETERARFYDRVNRAVWHG